MYEKILTPVDGSKSSQRAVEEGLSIANEDKAELCTLFVVDENVFGKGNAYGEQDLVIDKLEQDVRERIGWAVDEARKLGVKLTWDVVRGAPDEVIPGYAEQNDVDLIVIGSRSRVKPRRSYVGGSGEAVSASDIEVRWV